MMVPNHPWTRNRKATMSTLLFTLLLTVLACRSLMLQREAARHALLGSTGTAWWSVELRRRACVCSLPGDMQAFPQPREFRLRVWRCAGLPLWSRSSWVSLPLHCDALVDQLPADAFDHLFDPAWQLAAAGGRAHPPATARLIA